MRALFFSLSPPIFVNSSLSITYLKAASFVNATFFLVKTTAFFYLKKKVNKILKW